MYNIRERGAHTHTIYMYKKDAAFCLNEIREDGAVVAAAIVTDSTRRRAAAMQRRRR